MNKKTLLACLAVCSVCVYAAKIETSKLKQQAEIKITAYNHQLKTTLQAHIELGGLKRGVHGCDAVARNMTIQGSHLDWQLQRTSLKVRNPDNRPNSWEQVQLESFQREYEEGKPVSQLKVEQMSSIGPGKVVYRYMRGIEAEAICLNCHGTDLDDNVKRHLKEQYPNDLAFGYQQGDLMGAFTLEKIVTVNN